MRRDAAENRARLIVAAREVFAESGPDAPLEEIAARAGVSRMTLRRNFASRDELAAVVFEESLREIERQAERLRGEPAGLVELFDSMLVMQRANRGLATILARQDPAQRSDVMHRVLEGVAPLVENARAAGVVHPDVTLDDLALVLPMAGAATLMVAEGDPDGPFARMTQLVRRTIFLPPYA